MRMKNVGMAEWLAAVGSGMCSSALNLAGRNSCFISTIQEPLGSTKALPRKCAPKRSLFLHSAWDDPNNLAFCGAQLIKQHHSSLVLLC